jgi:hypothetical protein
MPDQDKAGGRSQVVVELLNLDRAHGRILPDQAYRCEVMDSDSGQAHFEVNLTVGHFRPDHASCALM